MLRSLLGMNGRGRVDVYTVHEPPDAADDVTARAEQLAFVRDGFSWGAALLPPVWLAWRGEWLALAAYVAVVSALMGLLSAAGAQSDWIGLAVAALNIAVGFEANEVQRWSMRRAGWRELGAVSGASEEDCERRFFETWLAGEALAPSAKRPERAISTALAPEGLRGRASRLTDRLRALYPR